MFWVLGSVLDYGKCFAVWEVLDSGKCVVWKEFGFWEVFCCVGSVLDSGKCFVVWEVFLDSGKCFGFWEVFWILGSVLSLWATIVRPVVNLSHATKLVVSVGNEVLPRSAVMQSMNK